MKKLFERFRKKRFNLVVVIATTSIVIVILLVTMLGASQKPSRDYAASVNGAEITQQELQERVTYTLTFFQKNKQQIDEKTVKNDTLNIIISEVLLQQHATQNNIVVNEQEVQDSYDIRVSQFGNEQSLLGEIDRLYGLSKDAYIKQLYRDALRDKVQQSLNQPLDVWLEEKRNSSVIDWNI